MQSVVQSIAAHAASRPDQLALIKGAQQVSYGELWKGIRSAAAVLSEAGVRHGERVLLAAPSAAPFVFGYFGAHLLGAVAVPYDPLAHDARRDELMARTGARFAFAVQPAPQASVGTVRLIDELTAVSPRGDGVFPWPDLEWDADLLFTTGSTGRPKGVRLTHRNIATSTAHINAVIRTPEHAVEVVPLPLYHAFGLGRVRCDLVAGRTVVLVDGFRLPGEIFAAIERHRASGLVGVPAGFAVLLGWGARGLGRYADQLRYIEIGSAPMPEKHKQALMELLPRTDLWMHYGLTEAARSAFVEFHRHKDRLDSVGLPAPGVAISIRAPDGSPQSADEPGVLWIGGKHIAPGYWDDSDVSAQAFVDGWVRTGDVARMDRDGFIVLHGRNDDMIKVGGFNVSPDEIEKVLADHPAVREAACIGVPDPRGINGQVVCAYVVLGEAGMPAADPEIASALSADLSEWLRGRLEPYKVPVRYEWVASLPRTESGKLLRKTLRAAAASA